MSTQPTSSRRSASRAYGKAIVPIVEKSVDRSRLGMLTEVEWLELDLSAQSPQRRQNSPQEPAKMPQEPAKMPADRSGARVRTNAWTCFPPPGSALTRPSGPARHDPGAGDLPHGLQAARRSRPAPRARQMQATSIRASNGPSRPGTARQRRRDAQPAHTPAPAGIWPPRAPRKRTACRARRRRTDERQRPTAGHAEEP